MLQKCRGQELALHAISPTLGLLLKAMSRPGSCSNGVLNTRVLGGGSPSGGGEGDLGEAQWSNVVGRRWLPASRMLEERSNGSRGWGLFICSK